MKHYFLLVNINKYILLNNLLAITRIQTWPSYKLYLYFLFRIPNYIFSTIRKVCCMWQDCNAMNVWFNYITLVSKRVISTVWGGLLLLYVCSVGIKCISKSNLIVVVWINHYWEPSRANIYLHLFIIIVRHKLYVIILTSTLLEYKSNKIYWNSGLMSQIKLFLLYIKCIVFSTNRILFW